MARDILYLIVGVIAAVAISVSITIPVSYYILDNSDDSSASASSGSAPSSSETTTTFSSFTEPRPAYMALDYRNFYSAYIGATAYIMDDSREFQIGSAYRGDFTDGDNFYPSGVRAPGFNPNKDNRFPTIDGSWRSDGDDVSLAIEPLRDGGFLVKSSPRILQLEEDEVVYRNVSVWGHLMLRDGCFRKDTYIQAFEATELGEVELEVFDPDDNFFVYLTKSIWEAKAAGDFLNLTMYDEDPSALNSLVDRHNMIVAPARAESFGAEGGFQLVVGSKAQASTLRWADSANEMRTIYANVSLAQGETVVFTTFAVFDQIASHGLLERGFDVWSSLNSIQSNFPQLVMGLPEDRAMIRNW
eukprot:TRINITY_DN11939_c1_g4_i1.p1 TRINITY_DN11939_c1_g4~~TRINITY_DN11939_c1_g4_i1.p1  ORF type:complete len:373 (+),score=43.96 TRINITY_DN11939_c1_g4_i1:47-1120(+)